jgi:hypothetical protein
VSTLKTELIYWPGTTFATRAEAEAAIFRYIDGWYNPRRIQHRLGGLSPDEYENAFYHRQQDQIPLPSNPPPPEPGNSISGKTGEPQAALPLRSWRPNLGEGWVVGYQEALA